MARPCSDNLEVTIAEFPSHYPPNVPFPKGTFRKFKQIANQYGLSVHSNSRFRHIRAKFMPKLKSHFNLDSVNTLRQDSTRVLGLFKSGDSVPQ